MHLDELVKNVDTIDRQGDLSVDISSVEYDSRQVKPGSLFTAIRGFAVDGNRFVDDAVARGAVCVVTDNPEVRTDVTLIRVSDARKALALLTDRFFGNPQNSLVMTALTGTNGKTTASYMVRSIFEAGGLKCGLIGTIAYEVGGIRKQSLITTPESRDIHLMLAEMVEAGEHACVMEVSSHALALSRVHGIRYRAVAFTNISRDHLDFHGSIEKYLDAKSILFSSLSGDSTAVVNADDHYAEHIMSVSRGGKLLTFGFGETCDIHPASYVLSSGGSDLVLVIPSGVINCRLPIPGTFNIANAMAAAGIGHACGFSPSTIAKGLESMPPVPGRYERIDEGQPFTVIVDYAHTPDALEQILTSAREIAEGRLISVFGCGGDRDRGKRPEMGRISGQIADYTIITSDNPRTEDPEGIIREVAAGVSGEAKFTTIVDRTEGIWTALRTATPCDTVVIAGKGHEDYQIIGTEKIHYDDAEVVRRILKAMEWKVTRCNNC